MFGRGERRRGWGWFFLDKEIEVLVIEMWGKKQRISVVEKIVFRYKFICMWEFGVVEKFVIDQQSKKGFVMVRGNWEVREKMMEFE